MAAATCRRCLHGTRRVRDDDDDEDDEQKGANGKWLQMILQLLFSLVVTFVMAAVGKEVENVAQDYDADVFLPSKALWLLGSVLFWTVWLLLRLLQMFLRSIQGLLWVVSVSMSPLCRWVSFLLSCVLLLLHHLCDAVYFATTCPLYVCGMICLVVFALLYFTSIKENIRRFRT